MLVATRSMFLEGRPVGAGESVGTISAKDRTAFVAAGWIVEVADEPQHEKAQAKESVVSKAVPGGKRARKQ